MPITHIWKRYLSAIYFCAIWGITTFSQSNDFPIEAKIIQDYIEHIESEQEIGLDNIHSYLRDLLSNPIDINKAKADDLSSLLVLNDLQVESLIKYRDEHGEFISLYELQVIPNLHAIDIQRLLPFITINNDDKRYHKTVKQMLQEGRQELYFRWSRLVENKKGFIPNSNNEVPFQGDPNQIYLRYNFNEANQLKFGFTLEKDPGEPLFKKTSRLSFDFNSFHIYFKQPSKHIENLTLGDYVVSMGQGLIMHNQFGASKNSRPMNIKKSGHNLKPYTSKNEAKFFRGIAGDFYINNKLSLTAFLSTKLIDTNIIYPFDGSNKDIQSNKFSSIIESGLHRTYFEIADKKSTRRNSIGGQLNFKQKKLNIGVNTLYEHFNKYFEPNNAPYNKYRFRGNKILNTSIDFSHSIRNINSFGEFAINYNGASAYLIGSLWGLNKYFDFSIIFRNYQKEYQSLYANAFGENSNSSNEVGLYLGMRYSLSNHWTISAFIDQWRHPWLKFRVDAPSTGHELFLKIRYFKKNSIDGYIQYKIKERLQNISGNDAKVNYLYPHKTHKIRIHINWHLNKYFKLRNRFEYSIFTNNRLSQGYLMYQDFIYKKAISKINLAARISYFNIDSFDARIYTYENDVLFNYSIPSFFNEGYRYYLNAKFKWTNNLSTEFRIAQTNYINIDQISSGNDLIDGNKKTDITIQTRFRF